MKPKPFASLNHFTRPVAMLPIFLGDDPSIFPSKRVDLHEGGQTKTPRELGLARRHFSVPCVNRASEPLNQIRRECGTKRRWGQTFIRGAQGPPTGRTASGAGSAEPARA